MLRQDNCKPLSWNKQVWLENYDAIGTWIVPFIPLIYILVPGTNIGPIMHKLYVLFVIYSIYISILVLTKTLGTRRASFDSSLHM